MPANAQSIRQVCQFLKEEVAQIDLPSPERNATIEYMWRFQEYRQLAENFIANGRRRIKTKKTSKGKNTINNKKIKKNEKNSYYIIFPVNCIIIYFRCPRICQ